MPTCRPACLLTASSTRDNIADMADREGSAIDGSHLANNDGAASQVITSTRRLCPRQSATATARTHEELIADAREHYTNLGYRVHSGLQFGCELVLYADHPQYVHSDFCVLVLPSDGRVDWRRIQCLTRSMPDYKKTLILAEVSVIEEDTEEGDEDGEAKADDGIGDDDSPVAPKTKRRKRIIKVKELAVSTEHAPFRHRTKKGAVDIGSQRKKQKTAK